MQSIIHIFADYLIEIDRNWLQNVVKCEFFHSPEAPAEPRLTQFMPNTFWGWPYQSVTRPLLEKEPQALVRFVSMSVFLACHKHIMENTL